MMAPSPSPVVPMQVEVQPVPSVIACQRYTECGLEEEPSLQICYTDTMGMTTDFDSDAASASSSLGPAPQPPQPQSTPSSPHRHTQTVRVSVGGEAFSFPVSAFQRFLGLPWKRDSAGVYCLNQCSAAVFEVLLDYTLFGTMPAYDTMSKAEWQEFETMALAMGGLTALIEHFDRKDSYLAKELRRGRKSKRRSSASSASRHFLINPEDSHSASPNSVSATRVARFLGVLCGVAESIHITRRRSSCGSSASKADHQDPPSSAQR